jgi:hypothetical protein
MKLISHRRNTIPELLSTNRKYGVEVDIRTNGGKLIIHHDPFTAGVAFEDWLQVFEHGTLILNVKEEGLEPSLIELMNKKGIDDYFFLDQSFPFLVKCSMAGEHKCAVRVSEFESMETALNLSGRVDWIWLDCFTKFPIDGVQASQLKRAGFKLCLVSPELQGRDPTTQIPGLSALLEEQNIKPDAICTKRPDIWESM